MGPMGLKQVKVEKRVIIKSEKTALDMHHIASSKYNKSKQDASKLRTYRKLEKLPDRPCKHHR